jgi:hypothetical protein
VAAQDNGMKGGIFPGKVMLVENGKISTVSERNIKRHGP